MADGFLALLRLASRIDAPEDALLAMRALKARNLVREIARVEGGRPSIEKARNRVGVGASVGRVFAIAEPSLPAGVAVLDLFQLPESAVAVLSLEQTHRLHVSRLSAVEVAGLIEATRNSVRQGRWDSDAARRLSASVIRPFAGELERVERIVVVPHGPWHDLSFVALPHKGRPLIEGWVLARLPIRRLLGRRAGTIAKGTSLLGVVDPKGDLSAAREVDEHLPSGLAAEVVNGPSATRARVLEVRDGVLHLGLHASMEGLVPRLHLHDGPLTGQDILGSAAKAELVVMAACASAEAPSSLGGERLNSLPRAFLATGSKAVVATSWPVEDAAASQLVRRFYAGLVGTRPDVALARAQRQMIRGDGEKALVRSDDCTLRGVTPCENPRPLADPRHWAAFTIYSGL